MTKVIQVVVELLDYNTGNLSAAAALITAMLYCLKGNGLCSRTA